MADEQDFCFLELKKILLDLGFLGYKLPNAELKMPFKKPKKQELTQAQKDYNKALSSQRVSIEHDFAHCKSWRVVKETFRSVNSFKRHLVFIIACKLHNFRTHSRKNI
jgi:hypothetical protein